jgi:hypothetical protein
LAVGNRRNRAYSGRRKGFPRRISRLHSHPYHSEILSKPFATSVIRRSAALGSERGSRIAATNKGIPKIRLTGGGIHLVGACTPPQAMKWRGETNRGLWRRLSSLLCGIVGNNRGKNVKNRDKTVEVDGMSVFLDHLLRENGLAVMGARV